MKINLFNLGMIIHPENDGQVDLNKEELKKCLDFVFVANGGNIFNG